jgi:hypothetical protein
VVLRNGQPIKPPVEAFLRWIRAERAQPGVAAPETAAALSEA